jgi:hypothetical protein
MLLAAVMTMIFMAFPALAHADFNLQATLRDPDRPPGTVGTGNTVSTALSSPTVTKGNNQVLATVRTTGKPGIQVPLAEGQKIMIELAPGTCYMRTPTAETYRDYIDWPAVVDGKTNQIVDRDGKPGIRFLAGTPRSLTIQIMNIDPQAEVMVFDFHFDRENTSAARVADLGAMADKSKLSGTISRLAFFDWLAGIVLPFNADIANYQDTSGLTSLERFSDLKVDWDTIDVRLLRIKPLVDAGFLVGDEKARLRKDDPITRAEAAALVGRLFPGSGSGAQFKDALPDWARAGIAQASANHIVSGYPDGTFRPDRALTGQEAATIVQKAFESYSQPGGSVNNPIARASADN